MNNAESIAQSIKEIKSQSNAKLLIVTKKQSIQDIMIAYNQGERMFGESYAGELIEKASKVMKIVPL